MADGDQAQRLLIANLGSPVDVAIDDHPILRRLGSGEWRPTLSTTAKRFNGPGGRPTLRRRNGQLRLRVPAASSVVFAEV